MSKDKSIHHNKYKQLGQNIKTRRIAKNLSQEDLAFEVSSARNYIGCIERGEKFPSLAFIFDIARALNCHVQDLFENI